MTGLMPGWTRRARAAALGYFWLPCPSCGEHFSGEEMLLVNAGGHYTSIPTTVTPSSISGKMICPACTLTGVGCRAHAEHGIYHSGCEFVEVPA